MQVEAVLGEQGARRISAQALERFGPLDADLRVDVHPAHLGERAARAGRAERAQGADELVGARAGGVTQELDVGGGCAVAAREHGLVRAHRVGCGLVGAAPGVLGAAVLAAKADWETKAEWA